MRKSNGVIQKIIDGRASNYEVREWLEFVDNEYLDKMIGLDSRFDVMILAEQRRRKIKKIVDMN